MNDRRTKDIECSRETDKIWVHSDAKTIQVNKFEI